jgi:hypothetical protein
MPYKDAEDRRRHRRLVYRADKEKALAAIRKNRADNPELYRATKLRHRYGLTHEQYREMYEAQNALCALCGERAAVDVDHDHITMRVRGLLCRACNVGLGLFGDSADRLLDAIAYLKRNP